MRSWDGFHLPSLPVAIVERNRGRRGEGEQELLWEAAEEEKEEEEQLQREGGAETAAAEEEEREEKERQ